jgi:hypothetical protein
LIMFGDVAAGWGNLLKSKIGLLAIVGEIK